MMPATAIGLLPQLQTHPLDVMIKGDSPNAFTVREYIRNFLWEMRFSGTWTLMIESESNELSDPFECVRKERDSAKVQICLSSTTYLCLLTPPRRYNISDVVSKLKAKNLVKKKSTKAAKIAKIRESLAHPPKPSIPLPEPPKSDVFQQLAKEAEEFVNDTVDLPQPESSEVKTKFTSEENAAIDEIVGLYLSGKQGKMNWFFRKMKGKPKEFQNEVFHTLKSQGAKGVEEAQKRAEDGPIRPVERKKASTEIPEGENRRGRVGWSEEEWEHLTDLVEKMRRNNPEPPLAVLINRAQAQIPAERRRKLNGSKAMQPIVDRLKERLAALVSSKEEYEKLLHKVADQKEAPTKEEILATLTDEEITQNFSQKILDSLSPYEIFTHYPIETLMEFIPSPMLIGSAVQKVIEGISESSENFNRAFTDLGNAVSTLKKEPAKVVAPSIPIPRPISFTTGRKPRVVVVGMKGDQPVSLESRLAGRAGFTFIDADQSKPTVPSSSDIVVFWAKFCSHRLQNQIRNGLPTSCRLITHHGGVQKLVEQLDAILPKC